MDSFGSGSVGGTKTSHTITGRHFIMALLWVLATDQIAIADTFAENLADFLLGSEAQAAIVEPSGSEFDAATQRCIACHNGDTASHVIAANTNAPRRVSSFGLLGNHPVGMNYYSYASSKPREFTRSSSLDPNIMLVDGNVSCISCHRPKDADKNGAENCDASGEFTIGPRRTDLCLACHNK